MYTICKIWLIWRCRSQLTTVSRYNLSMQCLPWQTGYNLYRMTWQWLSTHIYSSSVYFVIHTNIYLCVRDAQNFCSLAILVFHSSADLFPSFYHRNTRTLTHNSKLPTTIRNSFSRVTEPFHFRLGRNCYAHIVHTAAIQHIAVRKLSSPIAGSKENIYCWTFEDVLCTWFSWHFLVLADNLWYG